MSTIAEKWYKQRYNIKPETKLTNEQWMDVNMLHQCLQANNKPKLPHGTMLVNKKELVEHLNNVKNCLKYTDKLMLLPENKAIANSGFGTKMAKIWNNLNLTFQSISHFQLKIPLERLDAVEMEDLTDK